VNISNYRGYQGWSLLAIAILLSSPEWGGEVLRYYLRYQRAAIATGEWWRLLSAHLVHFNLAHMLANFAGLAVLWGLFLQYFRPRQWVFILIMAIAAIDAGLWWFNPQLSWYLGASGVLHGIMAAVAWRGSLQGDHSAWLLAGFLTIKLLYEQLGDPALFWGGAVTVIVDAHWYGAIGGLAAAAILTVFRN
jgi:rhomboid family GlyGly-CTERM serine protease